MTSEEINVRSSLRGMPLRPGLFEVGSGDPLEITLIGSRCTSCDRIYFPAKGVCSLCLSGPLEKVRLSRIGQLISYTIVRQGLPGFRLPYALGLIRLPEGVRLYSHLSTANPDELQIGMPVHVTVGVIMTDAQGQNLIGYCFEPKKGG